MSTTRETKRFSDICRGGFVSSPKTDSSLSKETRTRHSNIPASNDKIQQPLMSKPKHPEDQLYIHTSPDGLGEHRRAKGEKGKCLSIDQENASFSLEHNSTGCFTSYFRTSKASNSFHSSHKSLFLESIAKKQSHGNERYTPNNNHETKCEADSIQNKNSAQAHKHHMRLISVCHSFSDYFKARTRLSGGGFTSGSDDIGSPVQYDKIKLKRLAGIHSIRGFNLEEKVFVNDGRKSLSNKFDEIQGLKADNERLKKELMTLNVMTQEQEKASRALIHKREMSRRVVTETEQDIVILQGKVKQLQKVYQCQKEAQATEKQKMKNRIAQMRFWQHINQTTKAATKVKAKLDMDETREEISKCGTLLKKLEEKKAVLLKARNKMEGTVMSQRRQLSQVSTVYINLIKNNIL